MRCVLLVFGIMMLSASDVHAEVAETWTTPNGLQVVVVPQPSAPLVAVTLAVNAGPAHETPQQSGVSHLFEHLLFEGTLHADRQVHTRHIEDVGGGQRAVTKYDWTSYEFAVPLGQLAVPFWLLSERLMYAESGLVAARLAHQLEVVLHEKAQTVDSVPYTSAEWRLAERLYGADHPYAGRIIGREETLRGFTVQEARRFYRGFYTPSNALLVVVGPVDIAEVRALVARYFHDASSGKRRSLDVEGRARSAARRPGVSHVSAADVPAPRLTFAWIQPVASFEEELALAVLAEFLNLRLKEALADKLPKGWARGVECVSYLRRLGSIFRCDVAASDEVVEVRVEKVFVQAFAELLARFRDEPATYSGASARVSLERAEKLELVIDRAQDVVRRTFWGWRFPTAGPDEHGGLALLEASTRARVVDWLEDAKAVKVWALPSSETTP